jgi:glycosyltransferase involved in cell wall biosynthesis
MRGDERRLTALLIHNYYQQPGGEDRVFEAEAALLESHGDEVVRYTAHNDAVRKMSGMALATATVWNTQTYLQLRALIRARRPDVMHAHNTFPLISPSAYAAARDEGVPVVQTLHNYRLLCANALLFRDGHPCEECVGRTMMWPALAHKCYRGSTAASVVTVGMLHYHRARGTWSTMVDRYIALTDGARDRFTQSGLPAAKVVVKPNFVDDTGPRRTGTGSYALFVGRLAREKGIATLLSAWASDPGLPPLVIVGDGPLAGDVRRAAASDARIDWRGLCSRARTAEALRGASFLIFPSEWQEAFGLVLIEAFAAGLPVIAAAIGAGAALVESGRTGLHFAPRDHEALAARVRWAWGERDRMTEMGDAAYAVYQTRYTAKENYRQLRAIYDRVGGREHAPPPAVERQTAWSG